MRGVADRSSLTSQAAAGFGCVPLCGPEHVLHGLLRVHPPAALPFGLVGLATESPASARDALVDMVRIGWRDRGMDRLAFGARGAEHPSCLGRIPLKEQLSR